MLKSPDAITRMVLFQPATGMVIDAGGHDVLRDWSINLGEEYFDGGDGNEYLVQRRPAAECSIIPEDIAEAIQIMRDLLCPVKGYFFAFAGGKTTVWAQPTQLQTLPVRGGTGALATERLRLACKGTFPQVYQRQNLVGGFPWRGATATLAGGAYLLSTGNGETVGWQIASSLTPTLSAGGYWNPNSSPITLDLDFPVAGAVVLLTLTGTGSPTGTIEAFSWAGASLGSGTSGSNFTVPAGTRNLIITITGDENYTVKQPQLSLITVGAPVGITDPTSESPCLDLDPTAGGGGAGGDDGCDDCAVSVPGCPECFILYKDVSTSASFTDPGNITSSPGADGYDLFDKLVQQADGYGFTVEIEVLNGSMLPATPADAFNWVICDPICVLLEDGSSVSQRTINFCFISDEVASDTYTVNVTVKYECDSLTQTLSFTYTV